MIEFIKQIKGPQFLLYFLLYTICIYITYRIIKNFFDNSGDEKDTDYKQFGTLDFLVLSNIRDLGTMLKGILMNLLYKNALEQNTNNQIKQNDNTGLNELEQPVYSHFNTPKDAYTLFTNSTVRKQIRQASEPIIEKLRRKKLVKSEQILLNEKYLFFGALIITLMPGLTKLMLGIQNNKPVTFLILEIIAFLILFALSFPKQKLSKLGKKTLNNLRKEYEWIKSQTKNSKSLPKNVDPLMVAALFGVPALLMFPQFSGYSQIFPTSTYSGSSCSSCSTSSSCSSCSGGGGGGCGGCGGD